jgi:hypothetical protein
MKYPLLGLLWDFILLRDSYFPIKNKIISLEKIKISRKIGFPN